MYYIKILPFIIAITFSCFLFSQKVKNQIDTTETRVSNSTKLDIVVSRLKLVDSEKSKLLEKSDIIDQLYLTTNDSLKYGNTRKWLDSFFLKKINEKKLVVALELERYMIRGASFDFAEANDTIGIEEINDPNDIIKMINAIHESANQVGIKTLPGNEPEISESEKSTIFNSIEFRAFKQAYSDYLEFRKEQVRLKKELKENNITKENYTSEIKVFNSKSKVLLENLRAKKKVLYEKYPDIIKSLGDDPILEEIKKE